MSKDEAQEIVDESTDESIEKDVEDLKEEKRILRRPIQSIEAAGEKPSEKEKENIKESAKRRIEDIENILEKGNEDEEDENDAEKMVGRMGYDKPVDSKAYSQKLKSTLDMYKQEKVSRQKKDQTLESKQQRFEKLKKGPSTGEKVGAKVGAFFGYTRTGIAGGKILNEKIKRKNDLVKNYTNIIKDMKSYKNSKLKEYEQDGLSAKEQQNLTSIMRKIDNMESDKQHEIKKLIELQNEKSIDDRFRYMDPATAKKMGFSSTKTNEFNKVKKGKKGAKILSNIESGSNRAIFGVINPKGVRPKFGKEFGKNLQGAEEAVAVPAQAYEDPFTKYIRASTVPIYPAQRQQMRPESELNEDTGEPVEMDEQPQPRRNNPFNVDDWILNA